MVRQLRTFRILLVDDNADDVTLFQEAVIESGHPIKVVPVHDADQALIQLKKDHAFDLIISDLNMPRVDGLEFANQIDSISELVKIPVVLMSTSKRSNLPECIRSKLTIPYFTKPNAWQDYKRLASELYQLLNGATQRMSPQEFAERMTPCSGFQKFTG